MAQRRFSETRLTEVPGAVGAPVTDVYRWAMEQAGHIREGRFDLVDISNVADEIETVGRSEYDALVRNLAVVLLHMLKWDYQVERRSRSWALSIDTHRDRVTDRLEDSPSLKSRRAGAVGRAYRYARKDAARETGLPVKIFPDTCPYDWTDIMERLFPSDTE
jgi:hypothetical protein